MTDDMRAWVDRAVTLSMLWSGSLLAGSGLVLKFRLGPDQPRGTMIWGMEWQSWALLHLCLGLTMIALLSLHLWRHRRWIWAMLCRQRRLALVVVLLIALMLLLAPLLSPAHAS
jgi:hypothetical protein